MARKAGKAPKGLRYAPTQDLGSVSDQSTFQLPAVGQTGPASRSRKLGRISKPDRKKPISTLGMMSRGKGK